MAETIRKAIYSPGLPTRPGTAIGVSIKRLGKKKRCNIAILFPRDMALSEPYCIEGNTERRLDSLGYMRLVLDLGLDADVVDCRDIPTSSYNVLIAPADSLYDDAHDEVLKAFAEEGGTILISLSHPGGKAFSIAMAEHAGKVLAYEGKTMLQGKTASPAGGLAEIMFADGSPAVSVYSYGRGRVVQFGFDYGYEYAERNIPHVPRAERNSAIYPLSLAKSQIIERYIGGDLKYRGLEIAEFEKGKIVVNHTSYTQSCVSDGCPHMIPPRSAIII